MFNMSLFSDYYHEYDCNGRKLNSKDMNLLGSHFTGKNLYLLWGSIEESKLPFSNLSVKNMNIEWSELETVPEEYLNLFIQTNVENCIFVSSNDTLKVSTYDGNLNKKNSEEYKLPLKGIPIIWQTNKFGFL